MQALWNHYTVWQSKADFSGAWMVRWAFSSAILFAFHFVTKNNTMIHGMFHNVFKCLDIKISFLFSSEILSTNNNDEKIEIPKGVQDKNTASFMRNAWTKSLFVKRRTNSILMDFQMLKDSLTKVRFPH